MNKHSDSGLSPTPEGRRLRERLSVLRGREYWRTLEALSEDPEFRQRLERELPRAVAALPPSVTRREFVTLAGAALALAGLAGCDIPPEERIVPYVKQPESLVPGKPLYYATAMPSTGGATGLLIRCDMGRPTKVDGNPLHPASLGGTDPFAQASIYSFWDPDRSHSLTHVDLPSTWSAFLGAVGSAMEKPRERKGAGLAILTEEVLSPTLAAQLGRLLEALPEARWYTYEPIGRKQVQAGSMLAFGRDAEPIYSFAASDVVVSLDADFLACGPGRERYSHDYTSRRHITGRRPSLSRLYVVESTFSVTGSMADHRWPMRSSEIGAAAFSLAEALGAVGAGQGSRSDTAWVPAVARDLRRSRGRSVVLAGREQPAVVHALAAAMNHTLGNVGTTVRYIEPVSFTASHGDSSLRTLIDCMSRKEVNVLIILGGNPVYTAPADLEFGKALTSVEFRVHLGLLPDETSWLCHWHVPEAHFLESWGDSLAYDGTGSIIQPVIAPLYDGKSAHEIVSALAGEVGRRSYDIVREHWRSIRGEKDFESFWDTALHDGVIPETAHVPLKLTPRPGPPARPEESRPSQSGLEMVFRPDPAVWDGRFANNAWLQELPRPMTKLTWENAALISPATAGRLGLEKDDVVELSHRGRSVRAPVWVQPGQADGVVTVHLGYGRTRAGRIGTGLGFDAYALRASDCPLFGLGLSIRKANETTELASTQWHRSMDDREPIRVTTERQYAQDPDIIRRPGERESEPSLYPPDYYGQYAWGMVIDQSVCTGCNACVMACQVENNVPIVGKSQVLNGREMHWLRIDTYYAGSREGPQAYHQPVPCMHCEKAPCELVCPVNATVHSSEGLNQMIYNRCVGTRYCSNNCPYKVRHFNFFQYADFKTPSMGEMYNPDVTVRERGVMEKCSYCVQRITRGRIEAEAEGRTIREGEVQTACQQACPNGAIIFGDLSSRESEVARRRSSPLNYDLLGELNTHPRTTYLARVRNPNPEIEGA